MSNKAFVFNQRTGGFTKVMTIEDDLQLDKNGFLKVNSNNLKQTLDIENGISQQNEILDMNTNQIINLGESTGLNDAVTKSYVDTRPDLSQLEQGIRAYYSFDDNSDPYSDSYGNFGGENNGGTIVTGQIGDGFSTNGGAGYVDVGLVFDLGNHDFSISLWVNLANNTVEDGMILGTTRLQLRYSTQDSGKFVFYTNNGTNTASFQSSSTYSTSTWHHIVMIRNGSTGELFINGTSDSTGNVSDGDIGDSNGFIGDGIFQNEDAKIDEVGIWNRKLSDSEISYLYNSGSGTNSLGDFDWYSKPAKSDVDMNSNKITNLQDPINNQDAVTLKYFNDNSGGGGSNQRTLNETRSVASSNASQESKNASDFICDGTDDQEQIQNAIDEVNNLGGGIVYLSEGIFECQVQSGQNYVISLKDSVHLKGLGRAQTTIRKNDTGGIHIVQTVQNCNGSGCSQLTLDGVSNSNTSACLDCNATQNCIFEQLEIINGSNGANLVQPVKCVFDYFFISNCQTGLNLFGTVDKTFPVITNIKINPNESIGNQFTFPSSNGIQIYGSRWTISSVDIRTCGTSGIVFKDSDNFVENVTMNKLFNAFEFESGTSGNILQNVVININYQSKVGIIKGTNQTVRHCQVVDAGWLEFSLPQSDSNTVSPFSIQGDNHTISNLSFYEDSYSYVFDSNSVGIIDATGSSNLVVENFMFDANRQGNLSNSNIISLGIDLDNCSFCRLVGQMLNIQDTGLRLRGCNEIRLYDFRMKNIKSGIDTDSSCKRTSIYDGHFENMTNTVASMKNGNDTKFWDIECYDTGKNSFGTENSVFYITDNNVNMRGIKIEQKNTGFPNVESNGIKLDGSSSSHHLSAINIEGDKNGNLGRDTQSGFAPYALGRGIYISDNGNVEETTIDTNCVVKRCILSGIQIGSTSTHINLYGCITQNNTNTQGNAVGLQIADSTNSGGENGISQLRVIGNIANNNNDEFKEYGSYNGDKMFKNNQGIKNDIKEFRAQLRYDANAYYSFDGNNYLNDRINIYDGVEKGSGSVTQGSGNGIIGDSIVFDGTVGDYIELPSEALDFGTLNFTWQAWLYVSNMPSGDSSLIEAGGSAGKIVLKLDGATQQIGLWTFEGSATEILGNTTIQENVWYHIVAKRNSNNNYFVYLNGELEVEDTSGTLSTSSDLTGNEASLNIDTFSSSLDGRLDEVGCWFRDLHIDEITHLYGEGRGSQALLENDWHSRPAQSNVHMHGNRLTSLGEPTASEDATTKGYVESLAGVAPLKENIRAYYTFDGDYKDSLGNYDGVEVGSGSLQFSNTSIIGQSVEGSRTDGDYLDLGAGAMDFGTNDFSVSQWINIKSTGSSHSIWNTSKDSQNQIRLYIDSSDNPVLGVEESNNFNAYMTDVPLSAGQWNHVVVVRAGSNYRVYQNSIKWVDVTDSNADLTGNKAYLFSNDAGNDGLDGYMDEVGIWNRALSKGEIEHLYNNGNGNQYLSTFNWYSVRHNQNIDMDSNRVLNLPKPLYQHEPTPKTYVDSVAGVPPLKNDLRAYYTFDGDYKDSTTNHYDGTPNGTTFNNNTSVIGSALEFTSNTDRVNIGKAHAFGSSDFSVSIWVYPNVVDSARNIFLEADGNPDGRWAGLYGTNGNEEFSLLVTDGNSSTTLVASNAPAGQWYHVVFIKSGGTGQIWLNGKKSAENSIPSGNVAPTDLNYWVGTRDGNPESLDGLVDELASWNRVLTRDEIQHLFSHGNGSQYLQTLDWYAVKQSNHVNMDGHRITNLGEAFYGSDAVDKAYVDSRAPMSKLFQAGRAYYEFNGNYGDSIGNFFGTPTNFNPVSSNSMFDSAHEFTSGSDNVNIVETFSFGSSDFAISLWVYPKVANNNRRIILESGKGGTNDARFILSFGKNDVSQFSFYSKDTNGNTNNINSSPNFLINRWHHVILTRSAGTLQMWINGGKDVEGSISSGNIAPSGQDDFFGDGNSSSVSLDGLIDEVGVWDRILSESEIKYLYHNGEGTKDFVNYEYTFNYDIELNNNSIKNAQDITAEELYLTFLPTSDPMVPNQVWSDNGTLKISGGF